MGVFSHWGSPPYCSDWRPGIGFVAPSEPGKQVHINLEATDNATPPLVGYLRMVCNIK